MYGLSRRLLRPGDPNGDWVFVWSDSVRVYQPRLTLRRSPDEPEILLTYTRLANADVVEFFGWAGRLPPGTGPGTYTLYVSGDPAGSLVVAAMPAARGRKKTKAKVTVPKRRREFEVINCFDLHAADKVEGYLRAGRPVRFAAGVHVFDHQINLRGVNGPFRLFGGFARLVRKPDPDPDGPDCFGHRMFVGGDDLLLVDLELEPAWMVLHSNPAAHRAQIIHCHLTQGIFGYGHIDSLVQNCDIGPGRVYLGPAGHYQDNRFHDPPAGPNVNACAISGDPAGGTGQFSFLNNVFERCDRGPTVQTAAGPFTGNFFGCTTVINCGRGNNDGESFEPEGVNPYDHNIHISTRVRDCDGPAIQLWSSPARYNLYYDFIVEGGQGIVLAGVNGVEQAYNEFQAFEMRHTGGAAFGWTDGNGTAHGHNVHTNSFNTGSFIGYRQSAMSNQGFPVLARLQPAEVARVGPAVVAPSSLVFRRVAFADLPAGVTPAARGEAPASGEPAGYVLGIDEATCPVVRGGTDTEVTTDAGQEPKTAEGVVREEGGRVG